MVAAPVICTCFPRGSMADTGWCFFSLVLPSPDWMMAQRIEHCKGQNPCQLLQAATQGGSAAVKLTIVEEDPVTALHRAATGSIYHN